MWREAGLSWNDFLSNDEDMNKFVTEKVCCTLVIRIAHTITSSSTVFSYSFCTFFCCFSLPHVLICSSEELNN